MEINYLIDRLASNQMDQFITVLESHKDALFIADAVNGRRGSKSVDFKNDIRQYDPKQHEVYDPNIRRDKSINDKDGNLKEVVKVARLGLPQQKRIVRLAAAFLGNPHIIAEPGMDQVQQDMITVLNLVMDENKLNWRFKEISTRTMSERECAELWYAVPAETDHWEGTPLEGVKFEFRMRILSPDLGDNLLPVFDQAGDMVGFGRKYCVHEPMASDPNNMEEVQRFDFYTKEKLYFKVKRPNDTAWSSVKSADGTDVDGMANPLGKIPVIYYSQPLTEWSDVQDLIARLERKISNHADTNDYYDSPIVFAEGEIHGFDDKDAQGKLLQGSNGAKVSYLTWDNAPESMKMEIENLKTFIHQFTSTPDISFDNVKTLGSLSGVALKLLFMDPHLKASEKEEIFGIGVQRRLNYLKAVISKLQPALKPALRVHITPKFKYFMPVDTQGEVNTLKTALEAGIISRETAVRLNPLVENADEELDLIEKEDKEKAAAAPKIDPNAPADPNKPNPDQPADPNKPDPANPQA